MPWEAFISGKAGQERRNQAIWADAGMRLGMTAGGPLVATQGGGSSSMVLQITVPVSAGAVGNEEYLARTVTTAIQKTIRYGVIPSNWQERL